MDRSTVVAMDAERYELTDDDRAMLDLEKRWWRYPAAKDQHVLERFGLSGWRYAQRLHWLVRQPAALEHDAVTVRRVQRMTAARGEHRRSAWRS